MALKDIIIATRTVRFKGGEFTLNGLSFNDLTQILLTNDAEVREAFALFEKHVGPNAEGNAESMKAFGMALLNNLPTLTAQIIAYSAGEPDQVHIVKQLPAPVQIEAMIATAELTFEDADAVKKFMENLIVVMAGATNTLQAIRPMTDAVRGSGSMKDAAKA